MGKRAGSLLALALSGINACGGGPCASCAPGSPHAQRAERTLQRLRRKVGR